MTENSSPKNKTQTNDLKQTFGRISHQLSDCCLVYIPPNNTNVGSPHSQQRLKDLLNRPRVQKFEI